MTVLVRHGATPKFMILTIPVFYEGERKCAPFKVTIPRASSNISDETENSA